MMLGTLFASKVGIGFCFGLLFSIINLLDSFFVVTNIVTMLVGLFVKVLLGLFIWKNKGQIVRSLTKGKTELRDFKFPKRAANNRQQEIEQREDQQNRLAEQTYKTQTAENDYLRSGVELDRAYRQNDFQDNLLVQAGNEANSPESTSFDAGDTESVNPEVESIKSKDSNSSDEKEERLSDSEPDIEPVVGTSTVDQETSLPLEEMDDGLIYQQPSYEEFEQRQIDQIEENEANRTESPRVTHESQDQPVPVELVEAKQLAKEMGELRKEIYEEVEISEESAYEDL